MPVSHDEIAATALSAYAALPDRGKPKEYEWTVLAAFVLEDDNATLRTVALGTGSKCLGRGAISCAASAGCSGAVLHDSHAEVLARRSLLRLLYRELTLKLSSPSPSPLTCDDHRKNAGLLEETTDLFMAPESSAAAPAQRASSAADVVGSHANGVSQEATAQRQQQTMSSRPTPPRCFRLRSGCRLHLYVSEPPCGDASIYRTLPESDSELKVMARHRNEDEKGDEDWGGERCGRAEQSVGGGAAVRFNFTGAKLVSTQRDHVLRTRAVSLLHPQQPLTASSPSSLSSSSSSLSSSSSSSSSANNREGSEGAGMGWKGGEQSGEFGVREPGVQALGALRLKSGRSNLLCPAERTLSMCCSDKIVRWCVQGLQGTLLSRWIPTKILLSSVTVSCPTPPSLDSHPQHHHHKAPQLELPTTVAAAAAAAVMNSSSTTASIPAAGSCDSTTTTTTNSSSGGGGASVVGNGCCCGQKEGAALTSENSTSTATATPLAPQRQEALVDGGDVFPDGEGAVLEALQRAISLRVLSAVSSSSSSAMAPSSSLPSHSCLSPPLLTWDDGENGRFPPEVPSVHVSTTHVFGHSCHGRRLLAKHARQQQRQQQQQQQQTNKEKDLSAPEVTCAVANEVEKPKHSKNYQQQHPALISENNGDDGDSGVAKNEPVAHQGQPSGAGGDAGSSRRKQKKQRCPGVVREAVPSGLCLNWHAELPLRDRKTKSKDPPKSAQPPEKNAASPTSASVAVAPCLVGECEVTVGALGRKQGASSVVPAAAANKSGSGSSSSSSSNVGPNGGGGGKKTRSRLCKECVFESFQQLWALEVSGPQLEQERQQQQQQAATATAAAKEEGDGEGAQKSKRMKTTATTTATVVSAIGDTGACKTPSSPPNLAPATAASAPPLVTVSTMTYLGAKQGSCALQGERRRRLLLNLLRVGVGQPSRRHRDSCAAGVERTITPERMMATTTTTTDACSQRNFCPIEEAAGTVGRRRVTPTNPPPVSSPSALASVLPSLSSPLASSSTRHDFHPRHSPLNLPLCVDQQRRRHQEEEGAEAGGNEEAAFGELVLRSEAALTLLSSCAGGGRAQLLSGNFGPLFTHWVCSPLAHDEFGL